MIEFSLVLSLARCAMANHPNGAVAHQVERIARQLDDDGHGKYAQNLRSLLNAADIRSVIEAFAEAASSADEKAIAARLVDAMNGPRLVRS